jgi:hypothetical protein
VSRIGYVSYTGIGVIQVRYVSDILASVSEYPDNFKIFRYALIRSRYDSDTSMIFFSKYSGGFGQEYVLNAHRYALILH